MQKNPWVWYAPTLPGLPGKEESWMFERFLAAGISIAGIDVGESYGSPAGRRLFTAFYQEMTRRGYSPKPVLLGRSRGGLMTLGWAVENPNCLGAFAGIYPVCNVASYPGMTKAAPAYEMTPSEIEAHLPEQNPVDRTAFLALARVPLFAIHGDVDTVVPLEANSGLMRERYAALGGSMELIVPRGQGHNMWPGFFQSNALVDFVREHAGPNITVKSPSDYQRVQPTGNRKGSLLIGGDWAGTDAKKLRIEARLVGDTTSSRWRRIRADRRAKTFEGRWTIPASGWRWQRLEVRARSGNDLLAETYVPLVEPPR